MVHTPEPHLPFTPVPDVVKIIVRGDNGGAPWANIFHMFIGNGGSPVLQAQTDAIAAAFNTIYAGGIQSLKCATDTMSSVEAIGIDSATAPSSTVAASGTGTLPAPSLPASVAMVVSWKISRRYRGGKPRTYLSGRAEQDLNDSVNWKPGAVSSNEAQVDAFRTAVNAMTIPGATGTGVLCCVHYFLHNALLTPPLVSVIQGDSIDTRVCSQRRRLGRVLGPVS